MELIVTIIKLRLIIEYSIYKIDDKLLRPVSY